jgi:hypothetical protein
MSGIKQSCNLYCKERMGTIDHSSELKPLLENCLQRWITESLPETAENITFNFTIDPVGSPMLTLFSSRKLSNEVEDKITCMGKFVWKELKLLQRYVGQESVEWISLQIQNKILEIQEKEIRIRQVEGNIMQELNNELCVFVYNKQGHVEIRRRNDSSSSSLDHLILISMMRKWNKKCRRAGVENLHYMKFPTHSFLQNKIWRTQNLLEKYFQSELLPLEVPEKHLEEEEKNCRNIFIFDKKHYIKFTSSDWFVAEKTEGLSISDLVWYRAKVKVNRKKHTTEPVMRGMFNSVKKGKGNIVISVRLDILVKNMSRFHALRTLKRNKLFLKQLEKWRHGLWAPHGSLAQKGWTLVEKLSTSTSPSHPDGVHHKGVHPDTAWST